MSATFTALACAGMYVTTWPALLSVAIEPASLLLLPGLMVALVTAGPHDYSPLLTVEVSFAFYVVTIYGALWWRGRLGLNERRSSR